MKALKYLGIAVAALILLGLIGAMFGDQPIKPVERFEPTEAAAPEAEPTAIDELDPMLRPEILPGFLPHEVMVILKKEGMTDRPSHSSNHTMHVLSGALNGINIETVITTWRAGGESFATGFTSTAIVGLNPDIQAGLPFFQYMAGATYEGANPTAAHEWITANYNADSAAVTIGQGHWLLRATTPGSRVLILKRHMQ